MTNLIRRMIFVSKPETLDSIAKYLVKKDQKQFVDSFIGKATVFKSPELTVVVLDPANLSAKVIHEEVDYFASKFKSDDYGIMIEYAKSKKGLEKREVLGCLIPPFILAHFFNDAKKEEDDKLISTLSSLDFVRPEDLSIQMSFEASDDYVKVNINSKGLNRPVLTEKLNLMKAQELHLLLQSFIHHQEKK